MFETTRVKTLSHANAAEQRAVVSDAAVPICLLLLGAGAGFLYFWGRDLHRFTQWLAAYITLYTGQLAFYVVACYVVVRWSDRSTRTARIATAVLVLLFAAAFRAVLVPERPYLSADVYRYVWDGRVQANGINPYRYTPEADELTSLRDDKIFPAITPEDRQWLSPYPPIAQMVFLAVSSIKPMSVTAFKAAMSSFDLLAVSLLMLVLLRSGIDPARAIIFAWHPLVIFESAHSGHVEAVFIAFLALALLAWSSGKYWVTGSALALATLVKFYPILLLPVFLVTKPKAAINNAPRRDDRASGSAFEQFFRGTINKENAAILAAFVATAVLAYAPYLSAGRNLFGFVPGYVQEEGFIQTGARYLLLDAVRKLVPIPTSVFIVFAAACLISVALLLLTKAKRDAVDVARGTAVMIGLYLMLTTPRYAWYYAWLIPVLCFVPRVGWLYLTCASVLLYLVWYTPMVYPEIPLALGAAIYVPTVAWFAWEWWRPCRVTRRPP